MQTACRRAGPGGGPGRPARRRPRPRCARARLVGQQRALAAGQVGAPARLFVVGGFDVLEVDRAAAEHQRALERVFQLAHVAGPGPARQRLDRGGRDRGRPPVAPGGPGQHVVDQRRHVLGPLAQRRQLDRHHAQAVEEVLAKAPGGDVVGQAPVGGGDDPGVDRDRLRAPQPLHRALLERAQQLGLGRRRELGDLVEEQRAAAGRLEAAGAGGDRAGVGALLDPEQLRFEQRLGHRRAVDRDERPARPRAVVVDRPRDQLLAGARLAQQQHGHVARRDPPDQLEHALHRRAAADDPLAVGPRAAGEAARAAAPAARDRGPQRLDQRRRVERLLHVVERARAHRGDRPRAAAVRRDDDRRRRPAPHRQLLEQRRAVAVGQAQVEQHRVDRLAGQRRARLGQRRGLAHREAVVAQQVAQRLARRGVVLDQQHALALERPLHARTSRAPDASAASASGPGANASTNSVAPGSLVNVRVAPCAWAISCAIERPRPLPSGLVV